MKIVHIVRHGKALQDFQQISDDDRPLIEKGILNNIKVAEKLSAQYPAPEMIVSSYAARALHTAHIFARVMNYPHDEVLATRSLYLRGDKEVYDILEDLPDKLNSIMIVGHNPDLTYVVNTYGVHINNLPTSGAVSIRFETESWRQISKAKATYTFSNKE